MRVLEKANELLDVANRQNEVSVPTNTAETDELFCQLKETVQQSVLDEDVRGVIVFDLEQAKVSYSVSAHKACIVMLGAALEGVMLGTLIRSDVLDFIEAMPQKQRPHPIKKLQNAPEGVAYADHLKRKFLGQDSSFDGMRIALESMVSGLNELNVENIQQFRNAIHPSRHIGNEKFSTIDQSRSIHYLASLVAIARKLVDWHPPPE